MVAKGPDTTPVKSRTRTPLSGPGIGILPEFTSLRADQVFVMQAREIGLALQASIPNLRPISELADWSVRRSPPRRHGVGPCQRTFPFQRRKSVSRMLRG